MGSRPSYKPSMPTRVVLAVANSQEVMRARSANIRHRDLADAPQDDPLDNFALHDNSELQASGRSVQGLGTTVVVLDAHSVCSACIGVPNIRSRTNL